MAYDFQVNKVYRFDARVMAILGDMDIPRPIIPAAIKQMCNRFGVRNVPTVEFEPRRRNTSTYYPAKNLIKFPTDPRHGHHHAAIICHETAHAIQWQAGINTHEPHHGPTFVRIYIMLLAEFGDEEKLSHDDLMYEARKMGILIGTFGG